MTSFIQNNKLLSELRGYNNNSLSSNLLGYGDPPSREEETTSSTQPAAKRRKRQSREERYQEIRHAIRSNIGSIIEKYTQALNSIFIDLKKSPNTTKVTSKEFTKIAKTLSEFIIRVIIYVSPTYQEFYDELIGKVGGDNRFIERVYKYITDMMDVIKKRQFYRREKGWRPGPDSDIKFEFDDPIEEWKHIQRAESFARVRRLALLDDDHPDEEELLSYITFLVKSMMVALAPRASDFEITWSRFARILTGVLEKKMRIETDDLEGDKELQNFDEADLRKEDETGDKDDKDFVVPDQVVEYVHQDVDSDFEDDPSYKPYDAPADKDVYVDEDGERIHKLDREDVRTYVQALREEQKERETAVRPPRPEIIPTPVLPPQSKKEEIIIDDDDDDDFEKPL